MQGEFLACEDRRASIIGGFAAGKSWVAANWFLDRCMMYPEAMHCICAKDLPQAKHGPLETLKGVLHERGIDYFYNQVHGDITLSNGCKIKVLSAAGYQGFRALEADTIWADEVATWGPSGEVAFTKFLYPRLRYSPGGKQYIKYGLKPQIRISSNPSAIGSWLYELIVTNGWSKCWNLSTYDNFLMLDLDEYIDGQERTMSPDLWPYYLGGQWGDTTVGTVYKGFSRSICCVDPPTQDKHLPALALNYQKPLLWALDFNVGLMCSVVAQVHNQTKVVKPQENYAPNIRMPGMRKPEALKDRVDLLAPDYQPAVIYVLDELRIPNAGTPNVVDEFLKRYKTIAQQTGVILYGDASGSGRGQTIDSRQAARSDWAIVVKGLQEAGIRVEFRVPTANPSVMDRVNEVKAQIYTKSGKGLFIDAAKCPYLVTDLEAVKWKEGVNDIDKDNPNMTHLSDALGYLIWCERTLAQKKHVEFRRHLE